MHNPLKRFIEFIKTPGHSRTISTLVILIIAAAIPLTVLVAQKQQETRQRASGSNFCTSSAGCKYAGLTALPASNCSPACTGISSGICCGAPAPTPNCTAKGGTCQYTQCSTGYTPVVGGICDTGGYQQCCKSTTAICTANSKQCVSTTDYKICNSTGTGWGLKITCPNGGTCSGGNCVTAKCTSGATKCVSGSVSATCNSNGVWISSGCPSGSTCSTSTGKCTTATTCKAGTGSTNASCGGFAKNAIQPSSGLCCQYTYRCANGACTSACHDTSINQSLCSTGYCTPGAYQCSGQTLQRCDVNDATGFKVWTTLKTCSSPQLCSTSAKTCVTPITPTPRPTSTPAPTVCRAGTGSTIASCGGHNKYACTSTTTCTEYTWRCSGSSCVSGAHQSVAKTYCAKGSICNPNTVTPSPTPTPIPNCNANPQLSACVAKTSNTCSTGNGTQTVKYTTYNGSTRCTPISKTQTCTVSNCNAGNTCLYGSCIGPTPTPGPTSTPGPGHTIFTLIAGMDGIGSTGDNVNPNASSSNKNPLTKTRNLIVSIFDSNNNAVPNSPSNLIYSSTFGAFTGTVDLGANFVSGNYTIKVKSDGHLARLIPGIQHITSGLPASQQMPKINLVAGDVDNNNVLNINDYNILLSCVTSPYIANIDKHTLCKTNARYIKLSDLEDNGVVNEFDYNLFLREYSVQNGD